MVLGTKTREESWRDTKLMLTKCPVGGQRGTATIAGSRSVPLPSPRQVRVSVPPISNRIHAVHSIGYPYREAAHAMWGHGVADPGAGASDGDFFHRTRGKTTSTFASLRSEAHPHGISILLRLLILYPFPVLYPSHRGQFFSVFLVPHLFTPCPSSRQLQCPSTSAAASLLGQQSFAFPSCHFSSPVLLRRLDGTSSFVSFRLDYDVYRQSTNRYPLNHPM